LEVDVVDTVKDGLASQIRKHPMIVCLWVFLFAFVVSMLLILMMMLRMKHDEMRLWQEQHGFQVQHEGLVQETHRVVSLAQRYVTTYSTNDLQGYWESTGEEGAFNQYITTISRLAYLPGVGEVLSHFSMGYKMLFDYQVHAISLVLHGFDIPDIIMPKLMREYRLSSMEKRLSAQEKINQARSLLFQPETVLLVDSLWSDLSSMHAKAQAYYHHKHALASEKYSFYFMLMMALVLVMGLVVVIIVWMRLMEEDRASVQHNRRNIMDHQGGAEPESR
jgi:hypothetical protein